MAIGRTDTGPAGGPPPASGPEQLIGRIRQEYPQLSRQLQVIARYVIQHSDYLFLERIQDVAQRCGAQPSAVVRFAKHFGFHGFHDLKRAFTDEVRQARIGQRPAYRERVRPLVRPDALTSTDCVDAAFAFMDGACAGVRQLQRGLRAEDVRATVAVLSAARVLWVVGARRAYPVACYLAYAMQSLPRPVQLVSFAGAMQDGQLRGLRARDALVAISFAPYAEETLHAVSIARTLGVPVVVITDGPDSPLVAEATVSLLVSESTTFGFRALTNAMTLAQSIFVALSVELEALEVALPAVDAHRAN